VRHQTDVSVMASTIYLTFHNIVTIAVATAAISVTSCDELCKYLATGKDCVLLTVIVLKWFRMNQQPPHNFAKHSISTLK